MGKLGNYIKNLGLQIEKEIEEKVQENLPYGKMLTYLDCGCDDGAKTLSRAKKIGTTRISGIEVELPRIKEAKKNGVTIYADDLNKKWSIKSRSIDCMTATEVIEHIIDVDNFMSETKRVLKKNGTLILSTENLAAWHNIFALVLGIQPYTGPYISRVYPIGHRPNAKYYKDNMNKTMYPHLNVMTIKALVQLLNYYSFKVVSVSGIGFYPFPSPFSQPLTKIDTYHSSYCVISALNETT